MALNTRRHGGRTVARLALSASLACACFAAGAALAHLPWWGSLAGRPRMRPSPGEQPWPVRYSMRLGAGRGGIRLVVRGTRAGGLLGFTCYQRGFCFQYRRQTEFGVPWVFLATGRPGEQHSWADVGLKGRLLLRDGPRRAWVLLRGRWVSGGSPIRNGVFTYHGRAYRYDKVSGGWDELSTAAATGAGKLTAPRTRKSRETK